MEGRVLCTFQQVSRVAVAMEKVYVVIVMVQVYVDVVAGLDVIIVKAVVVVRLATLGRNVVAVAALGFSQLLVELNSLGKPPLASAAGGLLF